MHPVHSFDSIQIYLKQINIQKYLIHSTIFCSLAMDFFKGSRITVRMITFASDLGTLYILSLRCTSSLIIDVSV